jgi:hypothetical protein
VDRSDRPGEGVGQRFNDTVRQNRGGFAVPGRAHGRRKDDAHSDEIDDHDQSEQETHLSIPPRVILESDSGSPAKATYQQLGLFRAPRQALSPLGSGEPGNHSLDRAFPPIS